MADPQAMRDEADGLRSHIWPRMPSAQIARMDDLADMLIDAAGEIDRLAAALAAQQQGGEQACNRDCDCVGNCKMQGGA